MKKIVLIDGNNLIYRSYFATAYSGNIMKNSKGFPTNALYGLVNMLNKIIAEEKPHYLLVALDKGKTFRHEAYKEYKAGRKETPSELKMQFAKAKELMAAMGIVYLDKENYEADDIIGTFAKRARENDTYEALIISSDKDLLQLVGNDVSIKLLKSNAFDLVTEENFLEKYQLTPEKIIDLKALMGDSSDNIPGVKGIGEKTALKLLIEHGDLDGVYKNVESFSPKLKEKLVNDKSNAYLSYELATIDQDVPLDQNFIDFSYQGPNIEKLKKIYEELEFSSFLRNMDKVGNIKK